MFNSNKQMTPPNKTYKFDGISMKNEEAQIKIKQINDITASNNEALKKIPLGKMKKNDYQLPDKFSPDLYAIRHTCQIETMLIEHIKQLNKEKDRSIDLNNKLLNEQREMLYMKEKQLAYEREKTKELSRQNQNLRQNNSQMKNDVRQSVVMKQKNQQMNIKYKRLEHQFNNLRNKMNLCNEQLAEAQKKMLRHKKQPSFEALQPITFLNSQHNRYCLTKSGQQILKDFYFKNQEEKEKKLINENSKLKHWLKRFIDRCETILKIRLQKLRECGSTQQEVYIKTKYMKKMHMNVLYSFEQNEFPFDQMLNDFQFVVTYADQNKLEKDKLKLVYGAKELDRQLVTTVVNSLKDFHSAIIEEFKKVGEKRRQLAEQYQKLVQVDKDSLQLISHLTIKKITEFFNRPNRILKQVEEELNDFRKNKQIIKSRYNYIEPQFVTKMNETTQQMKNYVQTCKNKVLKDLQRQQFIGQQAAKNQIKLNEFKGREKSQQLLMNEQESFEVINRREKQQFIEKAKKIVLDQINKASLSEEYKQLDRQINDGESPLFVKQKFFRSVYNEMEFKRIDEPQNDQNLNNPFAKSKQTQQKNMKNQSQDFQI